MGPRADRPGHRHRPRSTQREGDCIMSTAESNELANYKPTRIQRVPAVASPLDVVHAAAKSGNVELYREALAFAKELDAFAARKAFNNALADAKAKLPILKKNRL